LIIFYLYIFYTLLLQECEELLSKGITGSGQGFDGTGRRLGGYNRQPSLSSLRQTTLSAAEKRARTGALLPTGPKRLGGNGDIMTALSPIQAAAMAAERRMYDDLWCGSLLGEDSNPAPLRGGSVGSSSSGGNATNAKKRGIEETLESGPRPSNSGASSSSWQDFSDEIAILWECVACTLLNQVITPFLCFFILYLTCQCQIQEVSFLLPVTAEL
jgi:DNA-dependent metalloprotease WSS1